MNETIVSVINEIAIKGYALIQTIDPNWLYSSIAQSSAAIVGLMGAFLTTKLITQKSIIKGLEIQIKENKLKIEFLKDNIKEKEEWVNKICTEEDFKDVENFLEEIEDKINVNQPPSVDQLIEFAKKSQNKSFHDLNKKMLEESYTQDYINRIKEKRKNKFPFTQMFGAQKIQSFINPQISGVKWDRYGRYNDEINNTYAEIKYIENLIKTKENELNIEKAGLDLKKTFLFLAVFSMMSVFLPLFMLSLSIEIMYSLRYLILVVVLLSWIIILIYLINEIKGLKRNTQY